MQCYYYTLLSSPAQLSQLLVWLMSCAVSFLFSFHIGVAWCGLSNEYISVSCAVSLCKGIVLSSVLALLDALQCSCCVVFSVVLLGCSLLCILLLVCCCACCLSVSIMSIIGCFGHCVLVGCFFDCVVGCFSFGSTTSRTIVKVSTRKLRSTRNVMSPLLDLLDILHLRHDRLLVIQYH